MAKKQYLDLAGLTTYNTQIKAYIDAGDDAASSALTTHASNNSHITNTERENWNTAYTHSKDNHAPADAQANVIETIKVNGTALTLKSKAVDITVPTTASDVGAAPSEHNHDSEYDTKGAASNALASAKTYTDSAVTAVKNDLLNGAGNAYDTLKELGDLIDDNVDAIEALETVAAGKADKATTLSGYGITDAYTKSDVDSALSDHGTHVTFSTTNPLMDGTASVGSSNQVARSDHRHPTDTSRASQTALDDLAITVDKKADKIHGHDVATTSAAGFMSTDMVTKLNGIATGANKTTVDTAMSSTSENPVQNKVIYAELAKKATTTALDSISSTASAAKSAAATNTQSIAANTSSINTHTSQISALQTLVGDGIEPIPNDSITALFAE